MPVNVKYILENIYNHPDFLYARATNIIIINMKIIIIEPPNED